MVAAVVMLWSSLGFVAGWHAGVHRHARVAASGDCCHHERGPEPGHAPGDRRDDCGTCVQLLVARPQAPAAAPPALLVAAAPIGVVAAARAVPGERVDARFIRTSRGPPRA